MTPLYFLLAVAGILGGGVMIASGLGMQWQGAIAILVGLVSLGIGFLGTSESTEPEATEPAAARNHSRPWTPEDFANDRITHPASCASLFQLKNHVDAAPDGSGFVVGYGDYISPVLITDDVHKLPCGRQLALALEATPGADAAVAKVVDQQNISGLLEDDFVRYECRLPLSPANVLALKITEFKWTKAALQLVEPFAPTDEAIESAMKTMFELAARDVREHRF